MKRIKINDYIHPGEVDCTLAVFRALEQCKEWGNKDIHITFDEGFYEFWPDYAFEKHIFLANNDGSLKRILFPFYHMENVILDGGNSLFTFHGRIVPVVIDNSVNVQIQNFKVDYSRPFFSQGEVIRGGLNYVEVKIDKEKYPYRVEKERLIFTGEGWESSYIHNVIEYEFQDKKPIYGCVDNFFKNTKLKAYELQNGILRLEGPFRKVAEKGKMLVFKHDKRYIPGIFITRCEDIILEGISIYQAGTMAILGELTKNIIVRDTKVIPTPYSDRVISSNADATHFVHCSGTILLENCQFESQLDDATNIHGSYVRINKIINNKEFVVKIMHHQQKGVNVFEEGDYFKYIHPSTLLPVGLGVVEKIAYINNDYLLVTTKEPIPVEINTDYGIENITAAPEVIIKNCVIRNNRARGFLIKTPKKVTIENNEMFLDGAAVKVCADMKTWHEAGATEDVIIKNNRIKSVNKKGVFGTAIFDIDPKMLEEKDGEYFAQNILITKNIIEVKDKDLIYGFSIKNLIFSENTVTYIGDGRLPCIDVHNVNSLCICDNHFDYGDEETVLKLGAINQVVTRDNQFVKEE